ncbi:hypothetical protein AB0J80_33610 [Actinoplanes sp. NPDC049548]|uniref:hypothetical protein n=1 Tax=Actinoplanes sp. NPDC049548 TaxID=3155152 RepID=UPI00341B255D
MRRSTAVLLAAAGLLAATASPASAAAAPGRRECGQLSITDALPVLPGGRPARRSVAVGEDCRITYGRVVAGEGGGYRTTSEMYDCCGILMTALTTRTDATTSTYDTHVNREPWDAGWSVESVTRTGGPTVTTHAEFAYRGIFDPTGHWYHNTHDTSVTIAADGTATCRQSVTLRHTFIGWHWEHSCSGVKPPG